MANFIIWLIFGAVIGWLGTFVLRVRGQRDLLINIITGMVGAAVLGYLVTPMFRIPAFQQATFNLPALFVAIVGALISLIVVYIFRRKRIVSNKTLDSSWTQVRGKIHVRWDRLSEEDIEQINGDHDEFIRVLQERYGIDEKEAEEDLQNYLNAVV